MKKTVNAVLLLCVVSFPVGILGKSLFEKLWTLENAQNRDLFLSALQSYFSDQGVNVDRSAPEFPGPTLKNMRVRAAQSRRTHSDKPKCPMINTYPTG